MFTLISSHQGASEKPQMQKICDIYNYFYLHKTQEKVLEVRYKTKSEREWSGYLKYPTMVYERRWLVYKKKTR